MLDPPHCHSKVPKIFFPKKVRSKMYLGSDISGRLPNPDEI